MSQPKGTMITSDGRFKIGDRIHLANKEEPLAECTAVFVDELHNGKWLVAELKTPAIIGLVTVDSNCYEIDPQFWNIEKIKEDKK
jgi:hypothetical protein